MWVLYARPRMNESEAAIDVGVEPPSLPEDRTVLTLAQLAKQALARREPLHVVGAEGCAPALVARALALGGAPSVLCVVSDTEAARRTAADLAFLSRGLPVGPHREPVPNAGETLSLLPPETLPWAEVHSDRRAQMLRTATLAHLAAGRPWRFAVTTASGLLRKVVPPKALRHAAVELVAEDEIDVRRTTEALSFGGYLRVPVVEDPGSFALRGGILDAWAPNAELPVRAELYGDLVVSLKEFDPEDQRTLSQVERAWLPPAREAVGTVEAETRAREIVRSLCDGVNYPSTKARALVEDVATGRAFFGP